MSEARVAVDPAEGARERSRAKVVTVAAELLAAHGRDALTTRAVAAAAGIQAPAIYRLFGDKGGLLDAVAQHGFREYLAEKTVREPCADPVEDLRVGWNLHVGFGLANPSLYALMYGDPDPGVTWSAAAAGREILEEHIRRIAAAGRLRVSEPLAADLVHASGCGTVLALLATPEAQRDLGLLNVSREAAISAITSETAPLDAPTTASAAITLRALLPETAPLTNSERQLLGDWLDRLALNRETSSPP